MSIEALTLAGNLVAIDDNELKALRTQIRGKVITPSDSGYDASRKIWNAMIDCRPALIVECTGTADVQYAVRFAKAHHLLISVRGAGHNIAGRALQNDVLLIDLSHIRTVQVDPDEKVALVCPGATLADVDHATQAYGLAVPTGINSTTGIAGLTLGGGFGWLSRSLGMTIDHLISAEVVTVDGERMVCDKNRHPDLFWAIRGGGGNFAIVTSFKFALNPVGPDVICGPVIFDIAHAEEVLSNYQKLCAGSPNEFTAWAVLRHAPPFPFLDSTHHGKPILALVGCYNGPMDKGKEALSALKKLGRPLGDGIAPARFSAFQQTFDPLLTPGARNYWKSHNFKQLSNGLIKTLAKYGNHLPNAASEIFIAQMGGETNKVRSDATAYPHRDVNFIMNVHTRWEKADQDHACLSWAREFYEATKPFAAGGVYMNFVSADEDNVEDAYAQNAARLTLIKSKYDPNNVLRINLNVAPSLG